MRYLAAFLPPAIAWCACNAPAPSTIVAAEITAPELQLSVPQDARAVLILFPGFGGNAAETREESKIPQEAMGQHVAVMLMDLSHHLFLRETDTERLLDLIDSTITAQHLEERPVFIGGWSAGGNVTVTLAKRLHDAPRPHIGLRGIFVVDPPLDLAQLYPIWKKHAEHSPFPPAQGEGAFVTALLDSTLGTPTDSAINYARYSPVTADPASVMALKDLPFRIYTEPDTAWWRINRGDSYTDMNAYYLEKLDAEMKAVGSTQVEYIATQGRGYQHGQRHPHAWSIVDEKDLLRWVLQPR